jgi:hypothetical protein
LQPNHIGHAFLKSPVTFSEIRSGMPINKKKGEKLLQKRYSYPQLTAFKTAKAPGQNSIGTGGQYSIGANRVRT